MSIIIKSADGFFSGTIPIIGIPTLLTAEVYQYNAYAHESKDYNNADEIAEYGTQGILDPNDVSYLDLFINGVLQPPVTYAVAANSLTLNTSDVPLPMSPVLIRFVKLIDINGNLLAGEIYQYNTVANGSQRIYTNADELLVYGNQGILNPNSVSFYNVYIDGVLQPIVNYQLAENYLELKMADLPVSGAAIIVEFVTVKDPVSGNPLIALLSQYNALTANKLIYTNADALIQYGSGGIPDPATTSYQNLWINGVIQPSVVYTVSTGTLTLNIVPLPFAGEPIILQSVSFYQ